MAARNRRHSGVMPKEITMFLDSYSDLIFVARQRWLQEPLPDRRRCAPGVERHSNCQYVSPADRAVLIRARQVATAAREVVGAILSWFASLPCDSRERLGSKEQ